MSGLYEKLDELRALYGFESIEEIVDGIIDRRRRINRMAELLGKVALISHELSEYKVLKQQFRQYMADLAKQKRLERAQLISAGDHFNPKKL